MRVFLALMFLANIIFASCGSREQVVSAEQTKLEKLCDSGELDSCVKLAKLEMIWFNNFLKAMQKLKKACDLDSAFACSSLAQGVAFGYFDSDLNSKDLEQKAKSLYKKECELKNLSFCMAYALYDDVAPKELGQDTIKELEKACENKDYDSCFNLALAYERGNFVKVNEAKANELSGLACDNKYTDACIHMAFNLKQKNKLDEAKKILDKICDDDCYACLIKEKIIFDFYND